MCHFLPHIWPDLSFRFQTLSAVIPQVYSYATQPDTLQSQLSTISPARSSTHTSPHSENKPTETPLLLHKNKKCHTQTDTVYVSVVYLPTEQKILGFRPNPTLPESHVSAGFLLYWCPNVLRHVSITTTVPVWSPEDCLKTHCNNFFFFLIVLVAFSYTSSLPTRRIWTYGGGSFFDVLKFSGSH